METYRAAAQTGGYVPQLSLLMLVFTSCVTNYLPKARVLAQSLKTHNPEWRFCLLLADAYPGPGTSSEPFDRIMRLEDLDIPQLKSWMFQHRLVELCTAVKGAALVHFLEKEHAEKVMYLDPDIMVFDSLEHLERLLDERDILLTPHQLSPQASAQAIIDNEICSLRHGVFNLGFLACSNRPDGLAFSHFWRDRLARWCRDDKAQGLFTDQKWCDLAPAYFPGLGIVRDPGCNVASWNLAERRIVKQPGGKFTVNGAPLRFYHFTGHDSGMGRIMSDIYGAHMPAVAELWSIYDRKLSDCGHGDLRRQPWQGAVFSNGESIQDAARHHYRDNTQLQILFPDPYATDAAGKEGFCGYWKKHSRREGNLLYVWARKPFRLARLTGIYLAGNGGLRGVPKLAARVGNIWRQEGARGILAKIRSFKNRLGLRQNAIPFSAVMNPADTSLSYWRKCLEDAFSGKNGVLVLDHQYGGGANEYRVSRINAFLKDNRPCLLLTWDFFASRLNYSFQLPGGAQLDLTGGDIGELARAERLKFGHILVNELVLWSSAKTPSGKHHEALPHIIDAITELKKNSGAFLEIAVHDYYSICPSYNLLEKGRRYCGVPLDESRCASCLPDSPFSVPASLKIADWRRSWQKLYSEASEIRVFSHSTPELLSRCFRIDSAKVRFLPHEPLEDLPPIGLPPANRPMRIGVIGHIAYHKGADILREMADLLDENETIVTLGELEGPPHPKILVTGAYERRLLPGLALKHEITCVLIPSIWPETFCYTVQEAMQLNLPLVVFPLGAQAERVADYDRGQIAGAVSAESALQALRELDQRRINGRHDSPFPF